MSADKRLINPWDVIDKSSKILVITSLNIKLTLLMNLFFRRKWDKKPNH